MNSVISGGRQPGNCVTPLIERTVPTIDEWSALVIPETFQLCDSRFKFTAHSIRRGDQYKDNH